MAPGITIQMTNRLPQLSAELRSKAARVVAETASAIEAQAKINAPVDTGNLRNSIQVQDGESDLQKAVVVGAEYGVYVELGTRRMAAQPYLIPAFEAEVPRFLDGMKQVLP